MLCMRVLVVSDIHSNITALEAVIADAGKFDAVWCLGDLLGYGPDPNECVERIRSLSGLVCLLGNHDQAALKLIPLSSFNTDARTAADWSGAMLSSENEDFLRQLESIRMLENFTLAHGSPLRPVWEYMLDPGTAARNFEALETDFCIVGHSHLPLIFHQAPGESLVTIIPLEWRAEMPLQARMILNPGSVGQPRDMDPRSSYAILDLEKRTWEPRRVAYDIPYVQARIRQMGLPERQARRLESGW